MQTVGRAAAVLAALVLGAALTWLLEPKVTRSAPEAGPAAPVGVRGPATTGVGPDRWLRPAGPVMAVLGVVFAVVVIPLDDGLLGRDLGIGLFYFIVVVDFVVLGLSLAGWGANTRASVDVYYRATAQLVAYVVPLGLAYIGAVMMARSLSTVAVVRAQQDLWFVVLQPLGFVLYLVTGLMQAYRAPFIEPFSASIAHGVYGSSVGWQAVLWRVALSGTLLVVAAMGAVLFLGGWQGPVLPGPAWMTLKTFGLLSFMVWAGARVPPLPVARMLELAWKVLIPVGLANVLLVGGLILLGVGPG